jgi:hypothetical protein
MRPWCLLPLVALLAVGCARPDADTGPAPQPGDVLRPELAFAPDGPWAAGDEVTVGMLVKGVRPDGEGYYLRDKDVDIGRAVMGGRLTFFAVERMLGEPRELPFVKDC